MDLINKPRSKSTVWMYFGLKADVNGQPLDTDKAICRLCRKIVQAKGGNTTNLRSHLQRRHRAEFTETASSTSPGTFSDSPVFDISQDDLTEEFPAFQTTPLLNYIPDAVLLPGEPWLQGGPSRALLSLPSCLRLRRGPESTQMADTKASSGDMVEDMKVYAKFHLQQGLMFGPFVGEVTKRNLKTSLKYSWAIRDDDAFFYIDASDENKSNWMRHVTYASSEEEHNLIVFQFNHQIYYRVSKPIPDGVELKVTIGREYATMLGLGMDENMKCDVGDKENILRIFQDIEVVTLRESRNSSFRSENSQSQSPMPIIRDVTSMSNPDAVESCPVSASDSPSTSLQPFPFPTPDQAPKYDFIPGAEKLLSHPNIARNGLWFFFGCEPDPTGQTLSQDTVVCKLCGEHVCCQGGASDIEQHLLNKHHLRPRDVAKLLKDQSTGPRLQTKLLSSNLVTASQSTLKMVSMLPQIMAAQTTNAIANFLIRDLHPPALVEGTGFKQLIHTLLPSYKELPSSHLLEGLLKELHSHNTKKLADLLKRRTVCKENEDISDYTAPIEAQPRRRGRPPGSTREVPHFVTLSVDAWSHKWQGDTEHYATLWAHYIDADYKFQNMALTTQRLMGTGMGDCCLGVLEMQVKAIAQEWGISQPNLVVLGGDGSKKMRLRLVRCEKKRESAASGPHPNSTTFLEREDSVTSDEVHVVEHAHPSVEGVPFIPCFFSAAQNCIEEVMAHPVISKTLGLFQHVLSLLFPLHTPKNDSSQQHIQSLLLSMPRQEQAQMKLWAHNRLSWNKLYSVLNTLVKHQNLVTKVMEIRVEPSIKGNCSESTTANDCCSNSDCNTSVSGSIMAPKSSDWKVLEDLCLVLKPLDVACCTLAKEAFPRLSLIKPILTGLLSRHLVPRPGESSAILKEVKKMIRCNLASSYDNPVVNRALCVACALDPQFHSLGFMEVQEQRDTFDWLKEEAVRMVNKDKRHGQAPNQNQNKRSSSPLSSESEGDYVRRSKRLKDIPPINFKELGDVEDEGSDWGEMDENEISDSGSQAGLSGMEFLLGDLFGSPRQSRNGSVEELVDIEISIFRPDKSASLGVEPMQWWRAKEGQFPSLATVARAYLAAPAVAGNAAQDFLQEEETTTTRKRSTMPPEILDWILFLHHNHMPITLLRQPSNIKEENIC